MEHTTGKLTFRGFSIYAADGKTPVADTCLNASVAQHDVANARRLVACWNACDGIPTKWLEGGAADILEYSKALKAQRDELLAGLEAAFPRGFSAINANVPDEIIVPVDFTMAELRAMAALIAKHKGAEHG